MITHRPQPPTRLRFALAAHPAVARPQPFLLRRFALLSLLVLPPAFLSAQAPQAQVVESPTLFVGQIFIVGNETTSSEVILDAIHLYPGQILQYPALRLAEANLARTRRFVVDPERGIRPTVTPLDGDGDFRDILVQVQERPSSSLPVLAGAAATALLLIAGVWWLVRR
jgi:hypothetical protein